jgi:uncharacterized protein (TIGR02118 family)
MVKVLVLFGVPLEPEAFDRHFEASHRPLVLQVPNLERLVVHHIAGAVQGETPFRLIVELEFDSDESMQEGLNSEAGQAMARDLSRFASGGVKVLFSHPTVEHPQPAESP